MALPAMITTCSGDPVLPALSSPAAHQATLGEVHKRFVLEAPHPQSRERVFQALKLYASEVWRVFPRARLWIDGGFVTHKKWAAPGDADVVVWLDEDDHQRYLTSPEVRSHMNGFLTLQGVTAGSPRIESEPRIQPMGQLIDGFIARSAAPAVVDYWHGLWSSVTDRDKIPVPGARKGFVEVVNPDA